MERFTVFLFPLALSVILLSSFDSCCSFVCVHMYVHECVWMWIPVRARVCGGQGTTMVHGVRHQPLPFFFFKQGLSFNLGFPKQVGLLTKEPKGLACFCLLSSWIASAGYRIPQLFYMGCGTQTENLASAR